MANSELERIEAKLVEVKEKQNNLVKERNEVYLEAKNKIKNLEDEIAKIAGSIQTLEEMKKEIVPVDVEKLADSVPEDAPVEDVPTEDEEAEADAEIEEEVKDEADEPVEE